MVPTVTLTSSTLVGVLDTPHASQVIGPPGETQDPTTGGRSTRDCRLGYSCSHVAGHRAADAGLVADSEQPEGELLVLPERSQHGGRLPARDQFQQPPVLALRR